MDSKNRTGRDGKRGGNWGGKRKNSGRKALSRKGDKIRTVRFLVALRPADLSLLRALARDRFKGNKSGAIRWLIQEASRKAPRV